MTVATGECLCPSLLICITFSLFGNEQHWAHAWEFKYDHPYFCCSQIAFTTPNIHLWPWSFLSPLLSVASEMRLSDHLSPFFLTSVCSGGGWGQGKGIEMVKSTKHSWLGGRRPCQRCLHRAQNSNVLSLPCQVKAIVPHRHIASDVPAKRKGLPWCQ